MKVEIIRCEDCDAEAEDGKSYAVARAMSTHISQIEAQRQRRVQYGFIGRGPSTASSSSLRPEIGSVGVPLMLDEERVGSSCDVRGYLAAVNRASYKTASCLTRVSVMLRKMATVPL